MKRGDWIAILVVLALALVWLIVFVIRFPTFAP